MYKKTDKEIELIKEGGAKLGLVLDKLAKMIETGVSGEQVDKEAERLIRAEGGRPAFKGYRSGRNGRPFPNTVCFSLNEELVHGLAAADKILKTGDIVSIDIGMQYPVGCNLGENGNGFFTDTSLTVPVGDISEKVRDLLAVTKKALWVGIKACGEKTIADIGRAIQQYVEPRGYNVVRDLVGHGVGHAVHEEPRVPNYYDRGLESWQLEKGVVIAIEPMVTTGDYNITVADDGWSISTRDKSLCAHFEHTIVISENGPEVVTLRPGENNLLSK